MNKIDILKLKPGMRVKDTNPTWEDYGKHGIVISVTGKKVKWKIVGGGIRHDDIQDMKILGLKNRIPESKLAKSKNAKYLTKTNSTKYWHKQSSIRFRKRMLYSTDIKILNENSYRVFTKKYINKQIERLDNEKR